MKEQHFFYVPDAQDTNVLPLDESAHALKALRLKRGDEMMLMDGKGIFYRAEVVDSDHKYCFYSILDKLVQKRAWSNHLHLAVAPTKMADRTEVLVEKSTEIGIDEFSFLECTYSERRSIKSSRIERIIVSAMKQSRKAWKPKLNEMLSFKDFIENHEYGHRYIAHCQYQKERFFLLDELRKVHDTEDIIVMIGPEGDFSNEEISMAVNAGFVPVSLSESRLRTETAGIMAVAMMQLSLL